ncbi:trypsin-like serine protease [Terasakiella sp. A23]|uniref:trypsin-like serine peptidase n=1 Tax=Terasakiella sp. FCG-A23 TaxID=3080561 RepID=UPI002954D06C|nr:trypsin-like serine protease [Terasakiella sp. A23]MDV7340477.1 trypsin-like serine protease [Terasakiella sp. A23]
MTSIGTLQISKRIKLIKLIKLWFRLSGIAIALFGLSACNVQHTTIDKNPLRKSYEQEQLVQYIGRLNKEIGGFCTGILIVPDLVLTGGHCFYSTKKDGTLVAPETLHFLQGYERGAFIMHAKGREMIFPDEFDFTKVKKLGQQKHNWALLRLEKKVNLSTPPPSFRPFSSEAETTLNMGYLLTEKHKITFNTHCNYDTHGPLISSKCGHAFISGNPILQKDKQGEWSIVAMHLSSYKNRRFAILVETILGELAKKDELLHEVLKAHNLKTAK